MKLEIFLRIFEENNDQISDFTKMYLLGAELFPKYRRTDGQTDREP